MKYLISIADVKGGIINNNVDDAFIYDAIEEAQQLYLRPLLGEKLYDKLLSGITETDGEVEFSLGDDYYDLITDYIHPYLKRQIEANICITLHYKLRNMGVVQNTDDHVSLPSYKEMRSVQQDYKDTASAYADILTRYLMKNKEKFPEYDFCTANPKTDTIIYFD